MAHGVSGRGARRVRGRSGPWGAAARLCAGGCLAGALAGSLAACARDRIAVDFPPDTSLHLPAGFQGFRFKGDVRTYLVRLPLHPPAGRLPLLLALHGYTGTAPGMEVTTGFTLAADSAGFVVIYPTGLGAMWNAGGFLEAQSGGRDDVGFLSALIDTAVTRYGADPARVFLTGHSNGGFMAYRIAHELAGKVAGVAPVAGVEFVASYPPPPAEVSILHIHALDDTSVPFDARSIAGSPTFPVDTTLAWWIARNRCNPRPDTLMNAGGVLARRWRSASGRADVLLYTSTSGGHSWPTRFVGHIPATDVILSYFGSLPPRTSVVARLQH